MARISLANRLAAKLCPNWQAFRYWKISWRVVEFGDSSIFMLFILFYFISFFSTNLASDRRMGRTACHHTSQTGCQCFAWSSTGGYFSKWQMDCVFDSNYDTYGCNKLFFLSSFRFVSFRYGLSLSSNLSFCLLLSFFSSFPRFSFSFSSPSPSFSHRIFAHFHLSSRNSYVLWNG